MLTFIQYLELVLNGKRVNTPKTKPVQQPQGAEFPDDLSMLAMLGVPLFDPGDDELQRMLDKAQKSSRAAYMPTDAARLGRDSLREPRDRRTPPEMASSRRQDVPPATW